MGIQSIFSIFLFLFFEWAMALEPEPIVINVGPPTLSSEGILISKEPEDSDLSTSLTQLPNFNLASGSNRPRFFQVRGVGSTSQFEHSQVNAFGIFYEGIDLSEEASTIPLFGRELHSVRYGPQSIDWGGKALAGVLETSSCLSNSACNSQVLKGSIGSYNQRTLTGEGVLKRSNYSLTLGASHLSSDGFYKNIHLDKPTNHQNETSALIGGEYSLGSLRVRHHHLVVSHKNGYDSWNFKPGFEILSDHPGRDEHQVHGHSLKIQKSAGDINYFSLSSLTFTKQLESYDEDWANNEYWNQVAGWNQDYNYFAQFKRDRVKFHQKLGIQTAHGLEIGFHFYSYRENQIIDSFKDEVLRKTSEPNFKSEHFGIWGKKQWFFESWDLGLSSRLEKQHVGLSGLGPSQSTETNPQLSLDIKFGKTWDANLRSEWSFTRGFRGGGYNTDPDLKNDLLKFGPEHLDLVEFSTQKENSDFTWMAKIFHHWHTNQQIRSSLQEDPSDPNTFTYYTTNTNGSRTYGLEGFASQKWRSLIFSGSVGLLKSQYNNHRIGNRDLTGRHLAQAAPWNYHGKIEYALRLWSLFVQLSGRDAYFHSVAHDFKSKSFHLVDLGGSYDFGNWKISSWIKNILDQRYVTRAFYFANEPPDWEEKYYSQLGAPKTYGLQLAYEY